MPYKGIETTDFACQSVEMTGVFLRTVYDPILNLVPPLATLCNARYKNRWYAGGTLLHKNRILDI